MRKNNKFKSMFLKYTQDLQSFQKQQEGLMQELADTFAEQKRIYEEIGKIGQAISNIAVTE